MYLFCIFADIHLCNLCGIAHIRAPELFMLYLLMVYIIGYSLIFSLSPFYVPSHSDRSHELNHRISIGFYAHWTLIANTFAILLWFIAIIVWFYMLSIILWFICLLSFYAKNLYVNLVFVRILVRFSAVSLTLATNVSIFVVRRLQTQPINFIQLLFIKRENMHGLEN